LYGFDVYSIHSKCLYFTSFFISPPLLTKVSINGDRLLNTIAKLGKIGQLANGDAKRGVQRLAFSPADVKARDLVQQWMGEVGMQVRVDAGGNIIGRYSSKNPDSKNSDLPAIATGSHIDTVPNGGLYDGAYGVLAAIEVVRSLQENSVQLNHPLEVIQSAIAETCEDLGLTYLHLPSRAGHDAQEMAKLTAMGMIFVPSQNGISHSEAEFTSPELCIHGTNVLLHTILKLDELL